MRSRVQLRPGSPTADVTPSSQLCRRQSALAPSEALTNSPCCPEEQEVSGAGSFQLWAVGWEPYALPVLLTAQALLAAPSQHASSSSGFEFDSFIQQPGSPPLGQEEQVRMRRCRQSRSRADR